jgi:hypothetical protein
MLIFKDYTIGYDDGRLTEQEIDEARHARNREILFWKLFKKLLGYAIFMFVLYIVIYSGRNSNYYNYRNSLENLLFANALDKVNISKQGARCFLFI